ncbi:MAG: chlorophyll a/b-binding protein [Cyanobacteriota bacterium]|nr:chlorophyll a/b-binding protein [Cyanobacteriota bacterium]
MSDPATAADSARPAPGSPAAAPSPAASAEEAGKPAPRATSATTGEVPAFGWSAYAERVNGRFAMLGFAAVLLIEALSHDTFLHWAGLVP